MKQWQLKGMEKRKKKEPTTVSQFHKRNKHQGQYDFEQLTKAFPELKPHVHPKEYGNQSIDFFNPAAVKALNKALLIHHYKLEYWDIPQNHLCPPIPGRAEYIHHIADLLGKSNNGKIPKGKKVKCLDIGTGANCIYPIIGNREYGWSFIGSDIADNSIQSARKIIDSNIALKGNIEIRKQENKKSIFRDIINEGELFDLTICNPPFHKSPLEAKAESLRKLSNLKKEKTTELNLNFEGLENELWCEGGERAFIQNMIQESKLFSTTFFLFSTLVSKKSNLKKIYESLKKEKAIVAETIEINHGNKSSRIVAWTFLNMKQRKAWADYRWR